MTRRPGGHQILQKTRKISFTFIHSCLFHLKILYHLLALLYTILYVSTPALPLFPWIHSDPYPPSFTCSEEHLSRLS